MLRLAYEDSGSACKLARDVVPRRAHDFSQVCVHAEGPAASTRFQSHVRARGGIIPLGRVPEPSKSAQLGEGCLSTE